MTVWLLTRENAGASCFGGCMARKKDEKVRWIAGWELEAWSEAVFFLKQSAKMVRDGLEKDEAELHPEMRAFLAKELRRALDAFEE